MALHFLKEKDRSGLITQTKTEVTNFKENEGAKRSQGQTKPGQKETTIEELVEARQVEKPRNKHLQGVGTQFRKRKSMVAIKHDAVSSKIKMFSNPLSTSSPAPSSSIQSKSKIRTSIKSSISTKKLLIEKKPEAVVNEILMKTLEEHRLGQMTANDTISCFDEIFATNCPSDLDESFEDKVEGPFNMLLEEEEITDPKGGQEAPPPEASTIQDQDEEKLETVEVENEESKGEIKEILESLEKLEEEEHGEEEVRYSCDSCGKHFKFLTYLKGHQSSKANCNSKEIKKKRQSMNVSRLGAF